MIRLHYGSKVPLEHYSLPCNRCELLDAKDVVIGWTHGQGGHVGMSCPPAKTNKGKHTTRRTGFESTVAKVIDRHQANHDPRADDSNFVNEDAHLISPCT